MSEAFYRFLLRCYPASFRKDYAEEMLQLFRDRSRDDKGAFASLRLWAELLCDLAVTLPRQHWVARSRSGVQAKAAYDGPFRTIEEGIPSTGAFFAAGTICVLFMFLLSVALAHFPAAHSFHQAPSRLQKDDPAREAARFVSENESGQSGRSEPATGEQQQVVEAVVAIVKRSYWDKAAASRIASALDTAWKGGVDARATTGEDFAALLTQQMRDAGGDAGLGVEYSREVLPERRLASSPEESRQYAARLQNIHCGFSRIELRPDGVGYLKLDWFPDPSICEPTARSAMLQVNQAKALIYDLRDSRGGDPAMVALMAAYLFDHPVYLYNPRENASQRSWTSSPVADSRLADKPVYILTSSRTLSGAEQFCYNLKGLKRAVLVGETTGGSAHAGVFHRIDDHFGVGVPEVHPSNPYGSADWEGVGVWPDVSMPAEQALETAEQLVRAHK